MVSIKEGPRYMKGLGEDAEEKGEEVQNEGE